MDENGSGNNATTWSLVADREVVAERVFDAPAAVLFRAFTEPDLITKWWGPSRYTTTIDKMDVRPGGSWRYVQHDGEGNEFAFRGEYREIVADKQITYTFEWEGMPGHIIVETVTFEEQAGKTKMTVTSVFDTGEDRDGMLASGMEGGANESYDRLAELAAELKTMTGPRR